MEGTEQFKTVIENHLNGLAARDQLFAKTLQKENKTIEECLNYILSTVKSTGKNGFTDSEIFGMAVHYYDEDSIKDVEEVNDAGHIVVNQDIELSEEEKDAIKAKAIVSLIEEERKKLLNKKTNISKKKSQASETTVGTLFD